jgi:glycosyltransferase involved in cell wall biosynthesis
MRVLFVQREPSLASARIRIQGLAPYLQELGASCTAAVHPSGPAALRALFSAHRDADVVVLQKKLPTLVDGWAWRTCRAPLVFDYDDAIPFRQEPRGGSYESVTRRRRFDRACALADAFTCGNDYLASLCNAPGKPLLVAPSPVPLDVPRVSSADRPGPSRVGWIGAPGNLDSLRAIAPALREISRRRDLVLVVISETGFDETASEMEGVLVEHVPWALASQERAIADLDVGIMPLDDSPWSRGKCAYKLLQYMAAGLPTVASPVGMNAQVVTHEENGLLAASRDDWVAALEALLSDPTLRARLGMAGRETVERRFSYPHQARRWYDFLEQVAGTDSGG